MNSTVNRLQAVFSFFTTVGFTVACVIAVTSFLIPQAPTAKLELRNVQVAKGRPHYYSVKREEYAHIKFSLDADLSSLFNWNTKQIFVYITASYPSKSKTPSLEPASEVVIWDAIIPADNAPWHPNTWIHPDSKGKRARNVDPSKLKAKNAKAKSAKKIVPIPKAYPEGTKPGIIQLTNQKPKYQVTDITGKIASTENATLTLHWNTQPWVGFMTWTNRQTIARWTGLEGGKAAFEFPALKGTEGGAKKEDLGTEKGGEANRGKPA